MSVAVAVLFFERVEQTIECLRSFLPSGVPIWVLNNGSAPASVRELARHLPLEGQIRWLHSDRNLGVAAGRNRLIRESDAEWLLFVDNDITVTTPQWRERFEAAVTREPRADVFVPRLYNVHHQAYSPSARFRIDGDLLTVTEIAEIAEANLFPGGASFIRRDYFQRVGFYDETFLVGFEDFELAIRGERAGHPAVLRALPEVELRHDHRAQEREVDRAAARVRYSPRHIADSQRHFSEKLALRLEYDACDWARAQLAEMGLGDSAC